MQNSSPFNHTGTAYNGRRETWASWEFQRAVADGSHSVNIGLNKGEARYSLKNALRMDAKAKSATAPALGQRKHGGMTVEPELLAHILLTGEYRWQKR